MNRKVSRKLNKGFTLVELIVVLVILAILAAMLVPALLGYIDKAKSKKDVINAKALLDASQAELVELYGKGYEEKTNSVNSVIPGVKDNAYKANGQAISNNRDTYAEETDFAKGIYNLTGCEEPYLFMIATGSTISGGGYNADKSQKDKYTVYYAVYMKTEKSDPLYFYDGVWTRDNPSAIGVYQTGNITTINGKKMKLQYYLLSNKGNKSLYDGYSQKSDDNLWWWLKNTVQQGKNG